MTTPDDNGAAVVDEGAPDLPERTRLQRWLDRAYENKITRRLFGPVWFFESVRDWLTWRKFGLPFWLAVVLGAVAIYFEVRHQHGGLTADGQMMAIYEVPLSWYMAEHSWWVSLASWISVKPGVAVLTYMVILPLHLLAVSHVGRLVVVRPKPTRADWINRRYDQARNEMVLTGPEPDEAHAREWDRGLWGVPAALLVVHEAAWRWRMIWGPWKDPTTGKSPTLRIRFRLLWAELVCRWGFPGPTPERRAQLAAWIEEAELIWFDSWMHARESDPNGRAARRDWWWRHEVYREWQPNGAYVPASTTTVTEDYDGGTLVEHDQDDAPRAQAGEFEFTTVATWTVEDDEYHWLDDDDLRAAAIQIVRNYQDEGPEGPSLEIKRFHPDQEQAMIDLIGPGFRPVTITPDQLGEPGWTAFVPWPSMQHEITGDSPETWRVMIPFEKFETGADEPEWLIGARSTARWSIEADGFGNDDDGEMIAVVAIRPR